MASLLCYTLLRVAGPVCWVPHAGSWSEQLESQKSWREGSCRSCKNKVVFAIAMVNWPAWAAECVQDIGLSQLTVVCWSQNSNF